MILTRRGFLESCLILSAAPALVRASSLMPVVTPWSVDWRMYVREIGQIICEDSYARFDILFAYQGALRQYHVDCRIEGELVKVNGIETGIAKVRPVALTALYNELQDKNIRVADLHHLPMPLDFDGFPWARQGAI